MMDLDKSIAVSENGTVHENGTHEQLPLYDEEDIHLNELVRIPNGSFQIDGANENFDGNVQSKDNELIDSFAEEVTESNDVTISEELGLRKTDELKKSKYQKDGDNAKTGKLLSHSNVAVTRVKNLDGKNGLKAQPVTVRGMNASFSKRPVADSNSKPPPTLGKVHLSKKPEKSGSPSSTTNAAQIVDGDKRKLNPLKTDSTNIADEREESSPSSMTVDAKPQRLGTLPTYNFSFKCNERAEKRKEFYSKLEEKIHAKEMEKSTLQAKSKENQEAEIKMLRKSLTFKATPMPRFYQEPTPPKTALKKIPTTRPKSPKFGRNKNSPTGEKDGDGGHSFQLGRLSLDEKISPSIRAKGPPIHVKKPARKSLPKLPSEKATLSNSRKEPASHKTTLTNETKNSESQQTTEFDDPKSHDIQQTTLTDETTKDSSLIGEADSATHENAAGKDKPDLTLVQVPVALDL